jgi:hypothetical protein
MTEKRKDLKHDIKQLLEVIRAENDALRKLIAAIIEEERKRKTLKNNSGESSNHSHI